MFVVEEMSCFGSVSSCVGSASKGEELGSDWGKNFNCSVVAPTPTVSVISDSGLEKEALIRSLLNDKLSSKIKLDSSGPRIPVCNFVFDERVPDESSFALSLRFGNLMWLDLDF